jgi:hypothetical protein
MWCLNTSSAAYLARLRGSGGALAHPNCTVKGGTLLGLPVLTSANIARSGSPSPRTSYVALVDASRIWLTPARLVQDLNAHNGRNGDPEYGLIGRDAVDGHFNVSNRIDGAARDEISERRQPASRTRLAGGAECGGAMDRKTTMATLADGLAATIKEQRRTLALIRAPGGERRAERAEALEGGRRNLRYVSRISNFASS